MTAKSLKHTFQSAIADADDTSLVRPTNWNADHDFFLGVNAQTGTSYALVNTDHLCLVTFSNASPVAVTVAVAGAAITDSFGPGWVTYARNVGAGTVTITPTTSTINGAATFTLLSGEDATIFSNGTNYLAFRGTLLQFAGAVTVTSASALALAVGVNGATNPAFAVDASTASQVAGLKVTGAVTGGTVAVVATDSGSNTNLTFNAKGSGTIGIGSVSTGRVTITPVVTITGALTLSSTGLVYDGKTLTGSTGTGNMMLSASPTTTGTLTAAAANFSGAVDIAGALTSIAHTVTSASATALAVGVNGATTPAFTVDSSTGSQVAGFKVTGAVTGGTVALVATDSGSNTNLTLNAKGSGTIGIGSVSTGRVTITPATTVTGALTLSSTGLVYDGKTLTGSTGTGNMMLSASPTTTGTLTAATVTASGVISTTDATASASSTTGSGKFGGGVGIAGKLYTGGQAQIGNAVDATSLQNGLAVVSANGTAVSLMLYQASLATAHIGFRASGTDLYIVNSTTDGLVTNNHGIKIDTSGNLNVIATTAASSTSTGALTVAGGLGVAGAIYAGGVVDLSGASAGQIAFPATQNASAGANTLDDYEEGTFTAGISFGGGTTGITYVNQTGHYTKIGDRVSCNLNVSLSAKGSSTGQAAITGLPFAMGANAYYSCSLYSIAMAVSRASWVGLPAVTAGTHLNPYYMAAGGATSVVAATEADFGNTSQLVTGFVYKI